MQGEGGHDVLEDDGLHHPPGAPAVQGQDVVGPCLALLPCLQSGFPCCSGSLLLVILLVEGPAWLGPLGPAGRNAGFNTETVDECLTWLTCSHAIHKQESIFTGV